MARKKSKRLNIAPEAIDRARREASGDIYAPVADEHEITKTGKVQLAGDRKATTIDLASEYAYVLTDLRSMALLAAGLFAILIVLSFIL
jgi:hypothetical protein